MTKSERFRKQFAIEELEDIKADLLNFDFNFHYDWFTTKNIIEIIDNHIKELKGENNENSN